MTQLQRLAQQAIASCHGDLLTAYRLFSLGVRDEPRLIGELFDRVFDSGSQADSARQGIGDAAGKNGGGVSQGSNDAPNEESDRPAAPKPWKKRKPVGTKISKAAGFAVAMSLYDKKFGTTSLTFRTASLYDIINAERSGSMYTRLMTLLRTSKAWPKDALLPAVYSEKELQALIERSCEAVPPLPPEALSLPSR